MITAGRETGGSWSDARGLIVTWLAVIVIGVNAIVARSVPFALVTIAITLFAIPWTIGKLRSRADARRLSRR
jgi:hypothetical protein